MTLQEFQSLFDEDEDLACELLADLHETDPQTYFECVNWYVDLVPAPGARA